MSFDLVTWRNVLLMHPYGDAYGAGGHMANIMRGEPLLHSCSPAVSFIVTYLICFAGSTFRQLVLGQPLVIVEAADEWLLPLFAMWLLARTSFFKRIYNVKPVKAVFAAFSQLTRVRRVVMAVGIGNTLFPSSSGMSIFVIAFVQSISTSWAWEVVERLTSSSKNVGPSPATDWRGFNVLSSVIASAALTASRSNEQLHLIVATALAAWFLLDAWIKVLRGGPSPAPQATNPPSKKETKKGK